MVRSSSGSGSTGPGAECAGEVLAAAWGFLFRQCQHVTQHLVDSRLPARPMLAQLCQNVLIQADRHAFLRGHDLRSPPAALYKPVTLKGFGLIEHCGRKEGSVIRITA